MFRDKKINIKTLKEDNLDLLRAAAMDGVNLADVHKETGYIFSDALLTEIIIDAAMGDIKYDVYPIHSKNVKLIIKLVRDIYSKSTPKGFKEIGDNLLMNDDLLILLKRNRKLASISIKDNRHIVHRTLNGVDRVVNIKTLYVKEYLKIPIAGCFIGTKDTPDYVCLHKKHYGPKELTNFVKVTSVKNIIHNSETASDMVMVEGVDLNKVLITVCNGILRVDLAVWHTDNIKEILYCSPTQEVKKEFPSRLRNLLRLENNKAINKKLPKGFKKLRINGKSTNVMLTSNGSILYIHNRLPVKFIHGAIITKVNGSETTVSIRTIYENHKQYLEKGVYDELSTGPSTQIVDKAFVRCPIKHKNMSLKEYNDKMTPFSKEYNKEHERLLELVKMSDKVNSVNGIPKLDYGNSHILTHLFTKYNMHKEYVPEVLANISHTVLLEKIVDSIETFDDVLLEEGYLKLDDGSGCYINKRGHVFNNRLVAGYLSLIHGRMFVRLPIKGNHYVPLLKTIYLTFKSEPIANRYFIENFSIGDTMHLNDIAVEGRRKPKNTGEVKDINIRDALDTQINEVLHLPTKSRCKLVAKMSEVYDVKILTILCRLDLSIATYNEFLDNN